MKPAEYMIEIATAFKKRDPKKLRKLNDSLLREASLGYSMKSYNLAIIAYVLSKILGKPRFGEKRYFEHIARVQACLDELGKCDDACTDEEAVQRIKILEAAIKSLESEDPRFVIGLFEKGRLKVAATLYAQGVSLGTASEITGVEKQEILSYAGHTMMFDRIKEEKGVKDRMDSLRRALSG
jgi:hypothetical protein